MVTNDPTSHIYGMVTHALLENESKVPEKNGDTTVVDENDATLVVAAHDRSVATSCADHKTNFVDKHTHYSESKSVVENLAPCRWSANSLVSLLR